MTLIPQRTVASQIAAQLRADIGRGVWRNWLPSERALSEKVQASRNTVRTALAQLKAEGIIAPTRGFGNRVIGKPRKRSARGKTLTVGLLIPGPIGSLRPFIALWIDELKDLLVEAGYRLRVHVGRHYYQANPKRALDRLVGQNDHDAWVLALSSHEMQTWFAQRGVPCIVAGTPYAGVALPSFDVDQHAICRHAAGVLLGLGHRRLGLLSREAQRAGDMDSDRGFLEGVRGSSRNDVITTIATHRDDVDSVTSALRRLLDRKEPPTGIIVCNSYAYLAAVTLLAQGGLRVPGDISLISRDDDPFLLFLAPTPARYVIGPHVFAKKMTTLILRLISGAALGHMHPRLLPEYTAGGSTASPAMLISPAN